jgi:transglutaminase-like putative cysteine protease
VSVWSGEAGWIDRDPTNDRVAVDVEEIEAPSREANR